MKLIKKWRDKEYKVDNYLYENKDGLKVIHTLNKKSLDTYVSFVVKGGTEYEKILKVPNGTAHFLEHMLINPNKYFKTQKEIDFFEFGTRDKPEVRVNGQTGYKYMTLYVWGNYQREKDYFQRILSIIDYPLDKFKKHINSERKVIISELQRLLKPEKDPTYNYFKFIFNDELYNSQYNFIGNSEDDIKSISAKDLEKYYKSIFTINNTILSVQSPKVLSQELIDIINKISNTLKRNEYIKLDLVEGFKQLYDEGYFHYEDQRGTEITLSRINEDNRRNKINYKYLALLEFSKSLLRFLGYDYLREKKGLIYGLSVSSTRQFTKDFNLHYYTMTVVNGKAQEALDELFNTLTHVIPKFLRSQKGVKWFESEISNYLFPNTYAYSEDYAEGKAMFIVNGYQLFDFSKAKKAVEKITSDELLHFFSNEFVNKPWKIWFCTPLKVSEIKKQYRKSLIYKHFSNLKSQPVLQ